MDRSEFHDALCWKPWPARSRWPILWFCLSVAVCIAALAFVAASQGWQPVVVLVAGMVLSSLVLGSFLHHLGRTARIEQLVVERTGELRESERYVRTVLESIHTAIAVIDAETQTIINVNHAAEAMIGAAKDEIIGRRCHQFICPAEVGKCPIINLGQTVDRSERVVLAADGRRVSVFKTVVPVELNGRRLLLESFVDISDRKSAEDVLRKQRDLGVALNTASGLEHVLQIGVEVVLTVADIDAVGIYLVGEDGGLRLHAHAGVSTDFVREVDYFDAGSFLTRRVVCGDTAAYSPDEPLGPELDGLLRREGMAAWGILPLRHEDRCIACIAVTSRKGPRIGAWSRHAVEAYASHVGTAMGRLLAEKAARQTQCNLQAFFDCIDEFALIVDSQGRLLHANRLVTSRLGYTPDELKHLYLADLYPTDRRDEVTAALARLSQAGRGMNTIPLITTSGELIQVETRLASCQWSNAPAFCAVAREMTARIRSEQTLRAAHAQLHQILNAAPPMCVIDTNRLIWQVNDPFCAAFGVRRKDIVGRPCHEVMPCKECLNDRCPHDRAPRNNERIERQVEKVLPDGRIITCLMAGTPFCSPDGRPIGVVESFLNITCRRPTAEPADAAKPNQSVLPNLEGKGLTPSGEQPAAFY